MVLSLTGMGQRIIVALGQKLFKVYQMKRPFWPGEGSGTLVFVAL